jgi:taurine transport system substrate-binding protein
VENPSLTQVVKAGGKVLVYSGEVAKWGYPTMDLLMVRRGYGKQHPEVVARFLKILAEVTNETIKNPADTAKTLSAFLSVSNQEASDMLAGYVFPTIDEQLSARWFGSSSGPSGMAKAMQATAQFTKDQGEIDTVLPDYSGGIDGSYMAQAKRLMGAQ